VISFTIRPPYARGKETQVPTGQEAWWAPPQQVWTLLGTEKSLPLPGIEQQTPGLS